MQKTLQSPVDLSELAQDADSGSLALVVSTKLLDYFTKLTRPTYTRSGSLPLTRLFGIPVKEDPKLPPDSWFLYTMRSGSPSILLASLDPI